VSPGNSRAELPIFIYDPLAAELSGMLDIVMWRICIGEITEVRVNCHALSLSTSDNSWSDPQIYCDKPQPTAGGWKCYPIAPEYKLLKAVYKFPPNCLSVGRNMVSVQLKAADTEGTRTIEKIELHTL
jgi:hypothetical protein